MQKDCLNLFLAAAAGFVFGLSWWITIDIAGIYSDVMDYFGPTLFLPVAASSVSLILVNSVPFSSENRNLNMAFKSTLAFGLILGFVGILSSVLLAVENAKWMPNHATAGIPLANCLILISNLIFKFSIVDDTEDLD